MPNKVFVLWSERDLFCDHFFPTADAAHSWARRSSSVELFLVKDFLDQQCLSEDPDAPLYPIYVIELTHP
jgi:hypothetical protein